MTFLVTSVMASDTIQNAFFKTFKLKMSQFKENL